MSPVAKSLKRTHSPAATTKPWLPFARLGIALTSIAGSLIVGLPAAHATAAEDTFTIDGITYQVTATGISAEVAIVGTTLDVATSVEIPSHVTVDGAAAAVTAIYDHAFEDRQLVQVTLPDTLESIGACAFCRNYLVDVTIPSGVQLIDNYAFVDNRLERVTISATVTDIGTEAFGTNPRLNDITFEGNAPEIYEGYAWVGQGPFGPAFQQTIHISATATGFTYPVWEGYTVSECGGR